VLAFIGGLVVLGTTANPGLLALAVADIAIAGTDIVVQTMAEELQKTPEGREFLETWKEIYLAGGIVTAIASTPQAIQSFYKAGNKLVLFAIKTKNFNYLNYARSFYLNVILEINIANFAGKTVKQVDFGAEVFKNTSVSINFAGATRMQEAGVLFVKGLDEAGKEVGFLTFYKGEVIASGTAKEVREALKVLWKARGAKLINEYKI
jgi:hypothetical protein